MEIGSIFEIHIEDLFAHGTKQDSFVLPFMKGKAWDIDFFNTGRSAIESWFKANGRKGKVWIPSFICASVTDAVKRAGCEIEYYPIDCELRLNMAFLNDCSIVKGDIFYLMQYFGYAIPDEEAEFVSKLKDKGVTVFEDITMSLLSESRDCFGVGDVVLGSLRKWFPIPDGAFIASGSSLEKAEKDNAAYDYSLYYLTAQLMKSLYLESPDKYDKKEFLKYSDKGNESLFSDYTIRNMSDISINLLSSVDVDAVIARRRKNYDMLYEMLKSMSFITLPGRRSEGMIPMGMFILTEDRDSLLSHLIANDVYSNVHWKPNDATEMFKDSAYLSRHCITIPCDQRYGEKEMEYICSVLREYEKNKK